MKYRLTQSLFLLIAFFLSGKLAAQNVDSTRHHKTYISNSSFRTWSVGVSGGIATPYTLIGYNARQDFTSPDAQLGYAIYIKDQLTNSFGLQGDLMMGKLHADHSNERSTTGNYIIKQFKTKINWSGSVNANFTIFHLGIAQPYLTTGGGVVSYSPVIYPYYTAIPAPDYGTLSSFFVPIGLGLKLNVAKGINLDFGYQVNFVMADDVDGYKYGPTNDRFSYSHVGLEFALGKKSKKQLATQSISIPVQNRMLAREQILKDELQLQQTQLAAEKTKNQQLSNDLDAANANLLRATTDSDGDGVPDIRDKCPNTPPNTKVDASGCPLPVIAATEIKPEINPKAEAKPKLTADDKRSLVAAAGNVVFYAGTDVISGRSFTNLIKVVRLLQDKEFSLKVDAYTNNIADNDADLRLAKLRAEAVKNYLANKGIAASRISVDGHGGFAPDISASKRRKLLNGGLIKFTVVQ